MESISVNIPEAHATKNLVLLLKTKGQNMLDLAYYPSNMIVSVFESAGTLKVTDQNNHAISKVYIKCFIKQRNNQAVFHLDGYTDLRGTFDYSGSLNEGSIQKVSILVTSPQTGSAIHIVNPPKGKKVQEGVVLEVKGEAWAKKVKELTDNVDFDDESFATEEVKEKKEMAMKRNKYWK